MRNFQDSFEIHKRSFISAFSICMTVSLNWFLIITFRLNDMEEMNIIDAVVSRLIREIGDLFKVTETLHSRRKSAFLRTLDKSEVPVKGFQMKFLKWCHKLQSIANWKWKIWLHCCIVFLSSVSRKNVVYHGK